MPMESASPMKFCKTADQLGVELAGLASVVASAPRHIRNEEFLMLVRCLHMGLIRSIKTLPDDWGDELVLLIVELRAEVITISHEIHPLSTH